ncbi:MAG: hypothetical protein SFX72_10620 [Isosphaeraceae bacterium]|nr:hypothetical protein [Isosphaeraceae bacterium]
MTNHPQNEPEPSNPETAEDVASAEATEPTPPPEPWTAEKVLEWNAYYDMYIAIGIVLLTLLISTTRVTSSAIWTQLQNGRSVSETFSPQVTDTLSYTAEGKRWVNIPWLANAIHYQVFKLVSGFTPPDPENPAGGPARAEQWGMTGLIFLGALLRGLTAFILLSIRRSGPGLWWSCLCVFFMVCYTLLPADLLTEGGFGFVPVAGGLSGRTSPSPEVWGGVFFAALLWILHGAIHLKRPGRLYLAVPLFLLWVNFDESFFVGLLVLAAAVVGVVLTPRKKPAAPLKGKPVESVDDGRLSPKTALIVLAASFGATFINPSLFWIYPAMLSYFLPIPGWVVGPVTIDQRSLFSAPVAAGNEEDMRNALKVQAYFFVWVGIGLVSFLLNRRRFSLPRLLVYLTAAAFWASMSRWQMEFGLTLGAVAALNGQEWYQDTFGVEGKLGRGWTIWSIGGRAVTLLLLGWFLFQSTTGYGSAPTDAPLSIGFNPADFPFESAEFLAATPLEGQVFNTSLAQGDALIWKSAGKKKSFIDSRRHLFSSETIAAHQEIQRALSTDNEEQWREPLTKYGIAAIMIDPGRSPKTYRQLMTSPRWIPFRDDGSVVLFGRADASPADIAIFEKNRLDAENLVYKNPQVIPSSNRLPRPTTGLDKIYLNRFMIRPEPRSIAAARWLTPVTQDPSLPFLPDPARALMAIREARIGLAANADDTMSYRRLVAAYRTLTLEESALLAGIEVTPANTQTITSLAPNLAMLGTRRRQLITSFNYAIQTTPPPQSAEARIELAYLNMELAQIYLAAGYIDLARDHFKATIDGVQPSDLNAEMFNSLTTQLTQLNQGIQEIETRLQSMSIEQQAGPLQQAGFAQSQGAIGIAIQKLEEAQQAGLNPSLVKGNLLDLYCEAGMVDKALELWDSGNIGDPNLDDRGADGRPRAGTAAMRQGRVFQLLGNYSSALGIWLQQALPRLEGTRISEIPEAVRSLIRGDGQSTVRVFLDQPEEMARQAYFEFDIALACLESGMPVEETAKHFEQALRVAPDLPVRPVIEFYLKKLGKPIPPTREERDKAAAAPKTEATKPAEAPKTEATKPAEAPKTEATKPAEAPKTEATKPAEAAKTEATKPAEAPKTEATKPAEAAKPKE